MVSSRSSRIFIVVFIAFSFGMFAVISIISQSTYKFSNPKYFYSNKFNETGYRFDIVPNIVHYVLFGVHEIQFAHFLSILSVLKNQNPDLIYINCDCNQIRGNYWKRLLRVANKTNIPIIVRTIERPTQIFGRNLSQKWLNWHSSDITRIRVLQEFGGIYLDRDVYVVQSLDVFRKFEMTLDWDEGKNIGSQTLIATKNARFLKLYLDSYHDYQSNEWYYNGGVLPTTILEKRPDLVHRVKGKFGVEGPNICPMLFSTYYKNWCKAYYAIHMFIRNNEVTEKKWCFNGKIPEITSFNESMASYLKTTFGEMMRFVLNFETRINRK